MQSTGHSSTHARSFTSMQGSAITKVMGEGYPGISVRKRVMVAPLRGVPHSGTQFRYVAPPPEVAGGEAGRRILVLLVARGNERVVVGAVVVAVRTVVALRVLALAVAVLVSALVALLVLALVVATGVAVAAAAVLSVAVAIAALVATTLVATALV